MSRHSAWEESNDDRDILSPEEMESRAWNAANKLVAALDEDMSGEDAEDMREYFATQCLSLLAQNYSIGAPD